MYDEKVLERYWAKVNKESGHIAPDMTTQCWEWTSAATPRGYGLLTVGYKKQDYAHRISWRHHFGNIPEGLFVCHDCDNPKCVRPDHLFLGTAQENTNDAKKKGRIPQRTREQKEFIALSKRLLDIEQAEDIRKRYYEGGETVLAVLANEYGVACYVIRHIVNGKTYNIDNSHVVENVQTRRIAERQEAIVEDYRSGNMSMSKLAKHYSVDIAYISRIINRVMTKEEIKALAQMNQEKARLN